MLSREEKFYVSWNLNFSLFYCILSDKSVIAKLKFFYKYSLKVETIYQVNV